MGSARDPRASPLSIPRMHGRVLVVYGACDQMKPWAGAKPQPFPPPNKTLNQIKYNIFAIYILRTPVERVVSPVLPVRSPEEEVGGSTPVETHKILHNPTSQPQGATWQPMTGPRGTSTTNQKLPSVKH
jgi:hypothetical protein